MPILEIELIGDPAEEATADLASRLADAAAEVFGSDPRQTWVRLGYTPVSQYGENSAGSPIDVAPVFVRVLKYRRPDAEQLRREVRLLAEAIGRESGRSPEQVHIVYEPDAAGRIAFGGKLVE